MKVLNSIKRKISFNSILRARVIFYLLYVLFHEVCFLTWTSSNYYKTIKQTRWGVCITFSCFFFFCVKLIIISVPVNFTSISSPGFLDLSLLSTLELSLILCMFYILIFQKYILKKQTLVILGFLVLYKAAPISE